MARMFFNIGQIFGPILAVTVMKTWNKYVFFVIVTILVLGSWLIWLYFHYQAMEKENEKDSTVIDVATDTTNDEVEVEVELVGKESK